MKYIITESMVSNAVSKYLDNEEYFVLDLGKKFNNYIYFLNSPDSEVAKICVYTHNAFGQPRNWIYISNILINEVSSLFRMGRYDSKYVIGEWVEKKLGITSGKIEDASASYEGSHRLDVDR